MTELLATTADPTTAEAVAADAIAADAIAADAIAARRRVRDRALLLWPRLDRRRLARTSGDPRRIARLVSMRTALPFESIVAMLTAGVDEP
jgi:hypothetical protein